MADQAPHVPSGYRKFYHGSASLAGQGRHRSVTHHFQTLRYVFGTAWGLPLPFLLICWPDIGIMATERFTGEACYAIAYVRCAGG